MAHCKGLVLLMAACAVLHVALADWICSTDSKGALRGTIYSEPQFILPAGSGRQDFFIPTAQKCNILNGVAATVCDVGGEAEVAIDTFGSLHVVPGPDYDAAVTIERYCSEYP